MVNNASQKNFSFSVGSHANNFLLYLQANHSPWLSMKSVYCNTVSFLNYFARHYLCFSWFFFQPNFKPEATWGFLYPLIRDLREAHRRVAPTTLINALLFTVVTCLVLKVWWRRTGRKFWWDSCPVLEISLPSNREWIQALEALKPI